METLRIPSAAIGLRHVFIRDMVLPASIGIYPHEEAHAQRVRINLDLGVEDDGARQNSRIAIGKDDLSRVVDYEGVAERVRSIVKAGHVRLVETLAERIAETCLVDKRIKLARIRVEKLDVFPDASSAGVEIERWQPVLSTPAAVDQSHP